MLRKGIRITLRPGEREKEGETGGMESRCGGYAKNVLVLNHPACLNSVNVRA